MKQKSQTQMSTRVKVNTVRLSHIAPQQRLQCGLPGPRAQPKLSSKWHGTRNSEKGPLGLHVGERFKNTLGGSRAVAQWLEH